MLNMGVLTSFGVTTTFLILYYYALKIYCKLKTGWCKSPVCLVGKTVIVTGANSGIGYDTAMDLAKRGARVILACRTMVKATKAQTELKNLTKNTNIIAREVDLCSFTSVRDFARDIINSEERLDILINNAGIGWVEGITNDGIPITMQTNYFSPFLLTHLLLPLMKKSQPSRIVNISSCAAKRGRLDLNTIDKYKNPHRIYSNSKLSLIYFTRELAKRLKATGVKAYSVNPGPTKTNIMKNPKFPFNYIVPFMANWHFKTPEEGAQTTLHVVLAPNLDYLNGEHFEDCKHVPPYSSAKDEQEGELLWIKSEEVVKLKSSEKILYFNF